MKVIIVTDVFYNYHEYVDYILLNVYNDEQLSSIVYYKSSY